MRIKPVQNADAGLKKTCEGAVVPREIATQAGKMDGMPGGVGCRRARRGKERKKTIFQVKKNHFS